MQANQNSNVPSVSYRMAQRPFFCHACNKTFKTMVDVASPVPTDQVHCRFCNSDFVEEQIPPTQTSAPVTQPLTQPEPRQPQVQLPPQVQQPAQA
jgi:hypothetical protein